MIATSRKLRTERILLCLVTVRSPQQGGTPPVNPVESSRSTPTETGRVNSDSFRPSETKDSMLVPDKPLDAATRAGLLAQLNQIDTYSPSFGPALKQRESSHNINVDEDTRKKSGLYNAAIDPNVSLNSSVASVATKKSNLMRELFGTDSY